MHSPKYLPLTSLHNCSALPNTQRPRYQALWTHRVIIKYLYSITLRGKLGLKPSACIDFAETPTPNPHSPPPHSCKATFPLREALWVNTMNPKGPTMWDWSLAFWVFQAGDLARSRGSSVVSYCGEPGWQICLLCSQKLLTVGDLNFPRTRM